MEQLLIDALNFVKSAHAQSNPDYVGKIDAIYKTILPLIFELEFESCNATIVDSNYLVLGLKLENSEFFLYKSFFTCGKRPQISRLYG